MHQQVPQAVPQVVYTNNPQFVSSPYPGQQIELPPSFLYTSQPPNGGQLEYFQPSQVSAQQQNIEAQLRSGSVQIPSHSSTPYLIPATSTHKKESVTIRVDDSTEMIRIQAQRIARLEERCDLLTRQYQRYVSALQYKEQEIQHWQERCNILQAHLETPYKRIEELQYEKNEVKRDQERISNVIRSGLEEFDALTALKQQKLADIKFWKERAKKAEKTQTIIMSLEHRIKMLQTENERLNQLIVKGSRYSPPIQAPVWQNN
ncbi:hypothetical protein TTHERM_00372430 (macronuclear) [Tetrahymena thermophila SB210]|uniref:Uncharacterized protein n=1 Tax=Tetrahymena thermophila (strain SB210) TaxID=312017 RepID=I7M740_TETTS|nr:hypothetical protein TTHERM_00372430 [Tetrahymena thermophila SB210]EAR89326.1 hypothetical protein TTHERM_00372430 [Tetrahymena thermophila SB210]|eukprot:XP_001009571.1 hypothetical protein TTHERM_00372430 [Tetrahymena thermophila SB210]